ncbi:MAG: hypothetical protein NTV49_06990 [Kiritimatiellaeota bacterium]|nr:hypothetical protein [Kiritimatiellota bacterium]
MRLFGVSKDGEFAEYVKAGFGDEHPEAVLEDWLENNPDGIVQDSKLLIIGRQVQTSLGGTIDLLALDRWGDLVILELKRGRTPRETIAQSLEYAAYAAQLDYPQIESLARQYQDDDGLSLVEAHRNYFALGAEEGVSFNKNQRIVIVGETITPEIRETAGFLNDKGLRVTCLEFSFFRTEDGKRLLSGDIVVADHSRTDKPVAAEARPKITREQFIQSLDANGTPIFSKVLALADERGLPIHWGSRGFSVNVNPKGVHFKFCYGYPPHSVYGQSIYTRLFDSAFFTRVNAGETVARDLAEKAKATGLFTPAGNELKCPVTRPLTDKETDALLSWIRTAADRIEEAGLRSDLEEETEGSNQASEVTARKLAKPQG